MLATSKQALNILSAAVIPLTVDDIKKMLVTSPPRSTIARALRRYRAKGLVTSYRNGGRCVLWSVPSSQPAKVQVSNPSSKGSSGRTTMCRPDNMPTLCAAIDNTVADLVSNKTPFSAYEVTELIRQEANLKDTDIDPAETGTVYVGGSPVPKIDHKLVREVVHDLFQRGKMDGYTRTHQGSYWQYEVSPPGGLPKADDDDGTDVPDSGLDDAYDGSSVLDI
jgi:hypothetical protein